MYSDEFSNRDVLITGGLGFLGSNLARRLLQLNARITLVDSLLPNQGGNRFNIAGVENRLEVVITDLRDQAKIRELVRGKHYLFNLAGQTSHIDSMRDPESDLDVNCRAQLSLLEACRAANPGIKAIFASTRQIYGRPSYLPVDEAHPLRPVDVNGVNKIAGESYHFLYANVHGIRSCALRLTNTIGPAMRVKDDRQTFLGVWIRQLLEGKPLEVWNGAQRRDLLYVDDATDAFLRAAASEITNGRVFNIGDSRPISLRDLAERLVEINGAGTFEIHDFPEDRKRIDIGDYYTDASLARSVIGWEPTVSLSDGLRRTLDYYRANLARYI